MIKKGLSVLLLSFLILACKKEGNKGVLKADTSDVILADDGKVDSTIAYNVNVNGKKTVKTDYVYKATDGTLVKVVFDYNPENRNVSITNNSKTFILNKTEAKTHETVYEKEDMKATVKGDSLIINQDNTVIELVKTKI